MVLLIVLFAIGPILYATIGSWIVEMRTGVAQHEGNSAMSATGWLFLLTFPISGILAILLTAK